MFFLKTNAVITFIIFVLSLKGFSSPNVDDEAPSSSATITNYEQACVDQINGYFNANNNPDQSPYTHASHAYIHFTGDKLKRNAVYAYEYYKSFKERLTPRNIKNVQEFCTEKYRNNSNICVQFVTSKFKYTTTIANLKYAFYNLTADSLKNNTLEIKRMISVTYSRVHLRCMDHLLLKLLIRTIILLIF